MDVTFPKRKLIQNNDSLLISIPKVYATNNNLRKGDKLDMLWDLKSNRLSLQKSETEES